MKHFLKVNIYETQAILYWILGVLVVNLGTWHWLGWVSITWGWLTFISALSLTMKHEEEIKNEFK